MSVANSVGTLGLIPLQAVKDRDSIQVSQLRSLSAADPRLGGAWSSGSVAGGSSASAPPSEPSKQDSPAVTSQAVVQASSAGSGGLDPELAALLGEQTSAPAGSSDSGLDPELAALLGETPTSPSTPTDSGLDPELAALLGESASEGSTQKQEDDGLDPELRALLGE